MRSNRMEIDAVDAGIVGALQADGRRPFTQIARDLGISEAAVRQRVARLEAAGVMQVVAVADPIQVGYKTMAMIGISVEPRCREAVAAALREIPEVAYLVLTAGSFDLLCEVVCEDNDHLLRVLGEELGRLEGIVATQTFMYLRLLKESYTWSMPRPAAPDGPDGRQRRPAPRPVREGPDWERK